MDSLKTIPTMWSLLPKVLTELKQSYSEFTKGQGVKANLAKLADQKAVDNPTIASLPATFFMEGSTAVMVIQGVITQKSSFFSFLFGGTTLDVLKRDFNILINDDNVSAIVLDIDSPGGAVSGIQEFANIVFDARDKKEIIAVSSSIMASAAAWIGAAASRVYISDDTVISGSIGVVLEHIDISELERKIGVKTTEITAGKFKRIASSVKPLSDEGRDDLQRQVDHVYAAFVEDVSKFRGVPVGDVAKSMADGMTFIGSEGIQAGLIDGIIALDDLIEVEEPKGEDSPEDININFLDKGDDMGLKSVIKAEDVTVAYVEENFPGIYDVIFKAGEAEAKKAASDWSDERFKEGRDKGHKEGAIEGAQTERDRIKAVEDKGIGGHEELVKTLKYDGKTTGAEAAELVLGAEQKKRDVGLSALEKEAPKALGEGSITDKTPKPNESKIDTNTTAQEAWDKDEKLKGEFDSFEQFEAYHNAVGENRVKVLSK